MRHLFSVGLVLVAFGCGEAPKPPVRTAMPSDWIAAGAEKRISDSEDVRLLRVSSPLAPKRRELDSTCILYRNHEFKTAQLVCPGGAPDLSAYDAP